MREKELLKKSGLWTVVVLVIISLFWLLFSIQPCSAGYTGGPQSGVDVGINSRSTAQTNWQVGSSGVYVIRLGIENVTGLGTATGYMTGTNTYYPRIEWTPTLGTFNFVGTGSYPVTVQINSVAIPSSGSVSGKINAVEGTGTGNIFTDTTLAGQSTLTATLVASGANISPTEVSYLDGMSENINNKLVTHSGSITNHTHTGSDGTTQISHTNLTNKGTQTHTQIDTFIASKALASGLASLDGSSLVVQNPASGTSTPGASKTVMSDGTGKILNGWLNDTVTKLGTPTTDNISEGSTNKYYTDARVNAAVGSLSVASLSDTLNLGTATEGQVAKKINGVWQGAASSVTTYWADILGSPVSGTSSNPYFALTQSDDKIQYGIPQIYYIPGTTTAITGTSASARIYNYTTSKNAGATVGSSNKLLLRFADGTSTITNSGGASHTFTSTNVTGTSTSLFPSGTSSAYLSSGYFDTDAHADFNLSTGAFVWDVDFSVDNPASIQYFISYATDRVIDIVSDGTTLQLYLSSDNATWNIADGSSLGVSRYNITFSANTRYHLEFSWDAVNKYRVYLDGVKIMETTSATALYSVNGSLRHGANRNGSYAITGKMENIRFNRTTGNSSNFTRPLGYYGVAIFANAHSLNAILPGTTTPALLLTGEGTATANRYLMADVTTLIVGAGTTTAVTGTTTAYKGWFDGAVRATAFNVASTEKIKENIKPIRIKPDLLDAESMAKQNYIAGSKSAWIAANQVNYQYVGSDTVTYVDTAAMESGYNSYIELDWASDINQDVYTENIQKTYEKEFWQMFDSVTPRSWTPKDKPTLTRKGFVVEDMPDVVKGDDGQSIDPMALIAYMSVVQQTLKADTIFALNTLKELITTGTVTQQKIDYIDDRLEVLNP